MTDPGHATTSSEERLVTGGTGRLLLLLSVGTTTIVTARFALAPVLPRIIDDLGISPALAGVALSVMWATVALLRYPSGRLADRLSRKSVLATGLAAATAGAAIMLAARSYRVFLLASTVIGIGIGLYLPAAVVSISDLFVERRGQAYGIYEAFLSLAGVVAAGSALLVPAVVGWRDVYMLLAVLLAIVGVLLHRWSDEPYDVGVPTLGLRETAGRVLGTPRVRRITLAFVLLAFAYEGVIAFLPTFLQIETGLEPALASNAFAAFFVVGILANPVAGGLGDRFGARRVAAASGLIGAAGLGLLVVADGRLLALLAVVALAAGLTASWPVMITHLMDGLPPSSLGGDFGVVGTVFIAVGSLGPTYVGVVAERAGYRLAFVGLAACLLGYVVVARWVVPGDDE